jgi:hypothetical protein
MPRINTHLKLEVFKRWTSNISPNPKDWTREGEGRESPSWEWDGIRSI